MRGGNDTTLPPLELMSLMGCKGGSTIIGLDEVGTLTSTAVSALVKIVICWLDPRLFSSLFWSTEISRPDVEHVCSLPADESSCWLSEDASLIRMILPVYDQINNILAFVQVANITYFIKVPIIHKENPPGLQPSLGRNAASLFLLWLIWVPSDK